MNKEGKARIQKIATCFQCRYGSREDDLNIAWCHEAGRQIEDMETIPQWCKLPLFEGNHQGGNHGQSSGVFLYDGSALSAKEEIRAGVKEKETGSLGTGYSRAS